MKYDPQAVRRFAESLAAASGNLPVALVEKDVWITYMLREIYSLPESKFLAFKGGTCLVKAYFGYYRFSEDIDLTWTGGKIKERDFRGKVIGKLMVELGLQWDKEKVKTGIAGTQSGRVMSYFLLAPTASGSPTKLKVTVDFNEKLEFGLNQVKLKPPFPQYPQKETKALFGRVAEDYFNAPTVPCYSLQEIACEKIRAILTRKQQLTRSRDIVDLQVISGRLGGLGKAAPKKQAKAKLSPALKNPSHKKEYDRATQDLERHLNELAAQAGQDPVFIEKPNAVRLSKFAGELGEYVKQIIND